MYLLMVIQSIACFILGYLIQLCFISKCLPPIIHFGEKLYYKIFQSKRDKVFEMLDINPFWGGGKFLSPRNIADLPSACKCHLLELLLILNELPIADDLHWYILNILKEEDLIPLLFSQSGIQSLLESQRNEDDITYHIKPKVEKTNIALETVQLAYSACKKILLYRKTRDLLKNLTGFLLHITELIPNGNEVAADEEPDGSLENEPELNDNIFFSIKDTIVSNFESVRENVGRVMPNREKYAYNIFKSTCKEYLDKCRDIGVVQKLEKIYNALPSISDFDLQKLKFYEEGVTMFTMLRAAGMFPSACLKFYGYDILPPPRGNAPSIKEIFESVVTFVSKVWQCVSDFIKQECDVNAFLDMTYYENLELYTTLITQFATVGQNSAQWKDYDAFEIALNSSSAWVSHNLKRYSQTGKEETWLRRKKILGDIRGELALKRQGLARITPFGIKIEGPSGVGKTNCATQMAKEICAINDFKYDKGCINTMNAEDKFMSGTNSSQTICVMDDAANTRPEKCQTNPLEKIILIANSVPTPATMPEAQDKGKIVLNHKVLVVTTNKSDLNAGCWSVEPLSILRRMHYHIRMEVKEEFREPGKPGLDPAKITEEMRLSRMPVHARFSLYTYDQKDSPQAGRDNLVKRELYNNLEYEDMMQIITAQSVVYFNRQKALVEFQNTDYSINKCVHGNLFKYCPHSRCELGKKPCSVKKKKGKCKCKCEEIIPEKKKLSEELLESQSGFSLCYRTLMAIGGAFLMDVAIKTLIGIYMDREESIFCRLDEEYTKLYRCIYGWKLLSRRNIYFTLSCFIPLIALLLLYMTGSLTSTQKILCAFIPLIMEVLLLMFLHRKVLNQTRQRIPRPSELFSNLDYRIKVSLALFISKPFVTKIAKIILAPLDNQKGAEVENLISFETRPPKNHGFEINEKPSQKDVHPHWSMAPINALISKLKKSEDEIRLSERCATTCHSDLVKLVKKHISLLITDDRQYCNIVPMAKGVWILPYHMVPKNGCIEATIARNNGHIVHNVLLWRKNSIKIGADLALMYIPKIGSIPNLLEYLPLTFPCDSNITACNMVYKQGEEVEISGEFDATVGLINSDAADPFRGLLYTLPFESYKGLCTGVVIKTGNKKSHIAGFHLAGRGKSGGAGVVTKKQVLMGIEQLISEIPGALPFHDQVPFDTKLAEVDCGPLKPPHSLCPTHSLEAQSEVIVYGEHRLGKSTNKSEVVPLPISDAVTKYLGLERIHGAPPDFSGREHKIKDITDKCKIFYKYSEVSFAKAYDDYSYFVLSNIKRGQLDQVRPIDDAINLCGLDGVLGINAIDWTTSQGFGYRGPKSMRQIPTDKIVSGITEYKEIDREVWEEVTRMEEVLASGKRINAPFKACLKDEAVLLNANKVRVFAACQFPMVLLVRRYFLSLCALVQRNQILFECAVGIVTQSPEWSKLYGHLAKFGTKTAVAGDYRGFDRRMSPKFMIAAYRLLIDIARKSGNYTERELVVMTGIASELTQPVHDYFGTILQFFGCNPSGHPMTVIVNSLVNSLYLRYAYYEIYPNSNKSFRQMCAALTYGDDMVATVSKEFPKYNHTSIQKVLAASDMEFTMPDKVSKSVKYVDLETVSFLKTYWKWDDELELYRSPCELSSIQKMLHVRVRSQLSDNRASCEAIKNASLRFFEFGRAVYEERNAQLQEVIDACSLSGYMEPLPSYEGRLKWYINKYKDEFTFSEVLIQRYQSWDQDLGSLE